MCRLSNLFKRSGLDLPSPSDIIPEEAISYDKATGKLVVDLSKTNIPFTKLPKVWPCSIPATRSMDPVFDHSHNNIYLAGADEDEQKIMVEWLAKEWFEKKSANIIVYQIPGKISIVHRLDAITTDQSGRAWWFKGDNNITKDPEPARDENIKYVAATIIY